MFTLAVGKSIITWLAICTFGATNTWFARTYTTWTTWCWIRSRRATSTCWKRFKYPQYFLKNLIFEMFYLGSWEIQNILTHKLYIWCQQHLIYNCILHLNCMMLKSYILSYTLKKFWLFSTLSQEFNFQSV